MKRVIAAVMLLASAAAVISAAPAQATIYEVHAEDFSFRNGGACGGQGNFNIEIPVGETVHWKNCQNVAHNITWDNGGFQAKALAANGGTASQQFNTAGFFNYHCTFHLDQYAMNGQVIVKGNVPTVAPATTSTSVAPTTTIKPTTTTQSTLDLNGVFDEDETTTSSSSTSTSLLTELAGGEDDDGSGNGLMIALLLIAIAAVGGGGYYAVRKMRET